MSDATLERLRPWLLGILIIPIALRLFADAALGITLWTACLLPLLVLTLPQIPMVLAMVIGTATIAIVHTLESTPWNPGILLLYQSVFLVGLWLGRSATTTFPGLQGQRWHPEDQFQASLERELARARRYERSLALLCVDQQLVEGRRHSSGLRSPLELNKKVRESLRVYVEVHLVRDVVYALVPEATPEALRQLVSRIQLATASEDYTVRVGVARYPSDAHCADDLVAIARLRRDSEHAQADTRILTTTPGVDGPQAE